MAIQIQYRRDDAATWTSVNPILAEGEPGYETDTGKFKVGNGVDTWSVLVYASGPAGPTGPAGATGATGATGAAGVGVPVGGTTGQVLSKIDATNYNTQWTTPTAGTVTSVGGTGTVSGLSLSGTVTSSGNLTLGGTLAVLPSDFASQTANTVLAAPNGVAGTPTFRAIVAADIPTLNQNTTGTAANVTGTVAIANGGTGETTAAAALTALGAYPASNPNGYTSNVGTVTSVAALTLGTTGTDLSSTVATGTTTPVITLNVPTASAANRGVLSSADWTTFNNKGNGTVTSITAGTGLTGGTITGSGTIAIDSTVTTNSGTQTLTNKRITPRVITTTSSATPTINTDNVEFYGLTAQAVDITSFTTNLSGTPTDGQRLWIYIVGTAARAITWGGSFESSTAVLPTTTVNTNRLDVGFVWNAVTLKWRCVAVA